MKLFNISYQVRFGSRGKAYRPEVVDQEIENAQDHNEHDSTELCLEAYHDHDASDESKECNNDSEEAPCTAKDESNEEEDQKHSASKLEVHLAILLIY